MRRRSVAFVALAFVLAASAARADDVGARAHDLKVRGDAAMDSLRYDEALADYKAAYKLAHDPAILYNVAQVHRARGEYPEALDSFEAFERAASPELRARVPGLAKIIEEIRAKIAIVRITTNVPARVVVRDRIVGTTPLGSPLRLAAGHARIEIDADGYAPYRTEVDLPGGETTTLAATLVAKPAFAPESPAPIARKTPIYGQWWFWTAAAVIAGGGVALTLALVLPRAPDSGSGFVPGQLGAPLRW